MKTERFDVARGAGDAFLGMEVSWDMGDSATDVAVPRSALSAVLKQLFGNDDALPQGNAAENLASSARRGWTQALSIRADLISVKAFPKTDSDAVASWGVYYRVARDGERDEFELGARVRATVAGNVVVEPPPDQLTVTSVIAERVAEAIAAHANACEHTAFNGHISEMLVTVGRLHHWVARRAAGGVYFLPGESGKKFMQLLDALEALTLAPDQRRSKFAGQATPQYADPRTLAVWHERTTQSFREQVVTLREKLADMTSRGNTRLSSFDNRVTECAELIRVADDFGTVLLEELAPLQAELEALRREFGDAQARLAQRNAEIANVFEGLAPVVEVAPKKGKKGAPKKERQPGAPVSMRSRAAILSDIFSGV